MRGRGAHAVLPRLPSQLYLAAPVRAGDIGPPMDQPEGAGGSSQTGGGTGSGGAASGPTSTGGVKLRLLTQAEYRSSLQSLFGTLTTKLTLPDDVSVAGYVSVGASQNAVSDPAATAYEAASLAAVGEVFGDTQRWQKLVGCAPKADLSDACVTTYIKSFGRIAFRRDLADVEVTAVANRGQERRDAREQRRAGAGDRDVRIPSIAELSLSGRDQQAR